MLLLPGVAHAQEHLTVVQLCDTQLGMGDYDHDVETFKLAVKQINALAPDLVVICGDLVDDGSSDKAFSDFNAIKDKFTVPCYPASGNHDVGNNPTPATLARYRKHIAKDYYTVDHKNYTFVIVNTQLWKAPVPEETEKQDAWFASVLAEAKTNNRPLIVAGHYPPFVNKPNEKEEHMNLPKPARAEFLKQCAENGVVTIMASISTAISCMSTEASPSSPLPHPAETSTTPPSAFESGNSTNKNPSPMNTRP